MAKQTKLGIVGSVVLIGIITFAGYLVGKGLGAVACFLAGVVWVFLVTRTPNH